MKEISIKDIKNIKIGNIEDKIGGTGCTVVICEEGMPAGLDVRGGGPASRETELLKPLANADKIHAILLSGGSAFGLDAAGGVMQYLEEHNIGLDVGVTKVPLVCQSCLFDLTVGDVKARPDKKMGYDVCVKAQEHNYRDGCYGAGIGATVGKIGGMDFAMKAGIGSYAVRIGELEIGAIVAVNAVGDIYENNQKIAGLLNGDKTGFLNTEEVIYQSYEVIHNKFVGNTTLGIIITNAKFNKTQLCKVASMTQNGYARSIRPVHTSADGDSIYAVSVGEVLADIDMVGTLAVDVMSKAIVNAVKNAESMYGLKSWKEINL